MPVYFIFHYFSLFVLISFLLVTGIMMFLLCTQRKWLPDYYLFYCFMSVISRMKGCDPISRFNPATFMCPSLIILVSSILGFSSEVILIVVVCRPVLFHLFYAYFAIDFNKQHSHSSKVRWWKYEPNKIVLCIMSKIIAKSIISDLPWFVWCRRGPGCMVDGLTTVPSVPFTTNVLSSNTAHTEVYIMW